MLGLAPLTSNDIFIDAPYKELMANGKPVQLILMTEGDGWLIGQRAAEHDRILSSVRA